MWATSAGATAAASAESDEERNASVAAGALRFVSELVKRVQSGIQKVVSAACAQITAAMHLGQITCYVNGLGLENANTYL